MILNQFQTVCPKLEAKCLGKLGNSKLFSAQYLVISKKKKQKKKKVFAKSQSDFLAEIQNSKLFSAQNKVISKKKKRFSPKVREIFLAEIRNSKLFSAQNKVISKKKKKRSSPKLWLLFRPISQIQTFEGGCFRMGGTIFHLSQKIGLKSTKSMRFCILHKPMGGLEPHPPPPWLRYCICSLVHLLSNTMKYRHV